MKRNGERERERARDRSVLLLPYSYAEQYALEQNLSVVKVHEDGVNFITDCAFNPDRLRVWVSGGVVCRVERG